MDLPVYDGIICKAPLAIERIVFHAPDGNIGGKTLSIWQYDDASIDGKNAAALEQYLLPEKGSELEFLGKARPADHWTVPYVTDHRYYLRWLWGLDFESVRVQIEPYLWEQSHKSVEFVAPHYEVRETIEFETENGGLQPNKSLRNVEESALVMGMNDVNTDEDVQEMRFAVNGRDDSSSMKITGLRCKDYCKIDPVEDPDVKTEMLWSDKKTWPNLGHVPEEDDEVEIKDGWEVVYDVETSPILKSLEVNGKLTF